MLAKNHKIYAIDVIGFGDSDKPRDADYSMAWQASLLRQFFDSQQLDRADLIGYSMGGWISLKFASQSPERFHPLSVRRYQNTDRYQQCLPFLLFHRRE